MEENKTNVNVQQTREGGEERSRKEKKPIASKLFIGLADADYVIGKALVDGGHAAKAAVVVDRVHAVPLAGSENHTVCTVQRTPLELFRISKIHLDWKKHVTLLIYYNYCNFSERN